MSMSENGKELSRTRYEGYSDYRSVSQRMAQSIDNAIEAYAKIQSLHTEGARVKPQLAANAKSQIQGAAMRLVPELRNDEEQYEEILERWSPGKEISNQTSMDEMGYLQRIRYTQLTNECPEWLHEFVLDIRTAGWEVGYLRAGQTVDEGPDDVVERESDNLFE